VRPPWASHRVPSAAPAWRFRVNAWLDVIPLGDDGALPDPGDVTTLPLAGITFEPNEVNASATWLGNLGPVDDVSVTRRAAVQAGSVWVVNARFGISTTEHWVTRFTPRP
jgi:hypothetical protein